MTPAEHTHAHTSEGAHLHICTYTEHMHPCICMHVHMHRYIHTYTYADLGKLEMCLFSVALDFLLSEDVLNERVTNTNSKKGDE